MSVPWDSFTKYKDGFNSEIYYNDKRGNVLKKLLDQFPDHQVVGAQQVAEWVDSSTRKLNGNNVWKLFPRYGLVCLVQKIDHSTQSNRLLVIPIFRWLKQWDGTPNLPPSADDYIKELGPTRENLSKKQAREATELLSYVIARLDASEVPDPKEAILWAKVAAGDCIAADQPEVSVSMQKLDGEEFGKHPSLDGLAISGKIGGRNFEIVHRERAERLARSAIYLFALAGCYNQKAAKANANDEQDFASSPVETDSEISQIEDNGLAPEDSPKGPYLIKKEELIIESKPPTFSADEDTGTLGFNFQLGPLWTRYTEEQ
jgi:hypothetical protein